MDDEPQLHCPHCGEPHLQLVGIPAPCIPGSRMRHGGTYTSPTGITLGTDQWLKVRCVFCRSEAMTPAEVVRDDVTPARDHDGAILSQCGACAADIATGHRPGYNRHRRRRRTHP